MQTHSVFPFLYLLFKCNFDIYTEEHMYSYIYTEEVQLKNTFLPNTALPDYKFFNRFLCRITHSTQSFKLIFVLNFYPIFDFVDLNKQHVMLNVSQKNTKLEKLFMYWFTQKYKNI